MIKVLFANNYAYLRGGAEKVLFEEMSLLKAHNVSICFFSRKHCENYRWNTEQFFPKHQEYCVQGFYKKIKAAIELIYSTNVAECLHSLIQEEKPNILHAHNMYGRLTTAIFDAAGRSDIPSVLTLHDYKLICPSYLLLRDGRICELCLKGGVYQCLKKRCHKKSLAASIVYVTEAYMCRILKKYKNVKYYISPSRFLINKHIKGGLSPKKIFHIPNAINVNGYNPLFDKGSYILFVGRLSREKGVRTLITSMIGLNIPLKIVGEGPLRQELKSLVQDKGVTGVSFEGYCAGDKLKELFRSSAFLVIPSEWYENAPMTILEAYGYGKPVIGSDIGGIPEMILDGETGLLFPCGDSDALRDKIVGLWSQPRLITRMGKAARDRVERKYNSTLHYENLMEVYYKALA